MPSHCRLCGELKYTDLIHLANENVLLEFTAKLQFMKIDSVNFHCKFLPKTVCQTCYHFTDESFKFYKRIEQAQTFLTNVYTNANTALLQVDVKIENEDHQYNSLEPDHSTVISDNKRSRCKQNSFVDIQHKPTYSKKRVKKSRLSSKNLDVVDENTLSKTKLAELINSVRGVISWSEYDWTCMHCEAKFDSMNAARDHSKVVHAICFGFKCIHCTELFNCFNPFVEHVRQHENSLKLYCQFCNVKSSTASETLAHSVTHWSTSQICTLCGEMMPSASALERHKKVYKKASLPQRCYKKKPKIVVSDISWSEYEWSCQDCGLPLPSIGLLRSHTREVHRKCFAMKCADCDAVMTNHKQFVDHAIAHRECLNNYCQYCNIKLELNDMENHISNHLAGPKKPCLGCGEIFSDSGSLMQHKTRYDAPKIRGANDLEDLTCGVCLKVFPNGFQLRNHRVIHNEERVRDQICHTCGKAFFDAKTLTNHIKTHCTKTETCEICKKTFLTKQRLKVHISTHLELKRFVCNECGKRFRRKSQLRLHLASHSDVLAFRCDTCGKGFRLASYLKIHERQHTGIRPYACEVCNEMFNHWGNCNRHMIRKHGVTLARTKITAHGKLDLNRETGEAKTIDVGANVLWCREMMTPKQRGRKKKVET